MESSNRRRTLAYYQAYLSDEEWSDYLRQRRQAIVAPQNNWRVLMEQYSKGIGWDPAARECEWQRIQESHQCFVASTHEEWEQYERSIAELVAARSRGGAGSCSQT